MPLHTGKAIRFLDFRPDGDYLPGLFTCAQFPTTGQIPHVPDVDVTLKFLPGYCGPGSGDGGNRGEYATMALLDLAELWEAAEPWSGRYCFA